MAHLKKTSLIALILLGGFLPVLAYLALHRGLNPSEISQFQSPDPPGRLGLIAGLFIIKPVYLFICIELILLLYGQVSLSMRSLFWGLVLFLLGELICGATYVAFQRELIVSEHIHSYGMILQFAFVIFALLETQDQTILNGRSRTRSVFVLGIAVCMVISLLPLSVSIIPDGYRVDLFGYPYSYARFEFNQWVETRALPFSSLFFFLMACFMLLATKRTNRLPSAKISFSAGAGPLLFSLLRVTLGTLFAGDLVWFEFWEEVSELLLIFTIAFVLWRSRPELIKAALLRYF